MAGGGTAGVDLTRKFVTEAELDDKRKKRQEEWDKVRKPEDPEGESRPDPRTKFQSGLAAIDRLIIDNQMSLYKLSED